MTEAQHLAAIARDLDDDGPRLVYADWLAERGDPRGELIQVQCALARGWKRTLQYRSDKLLGEHGRAWEIHLRGSVLAWVGRVERLVWERGFPEEVHLHGAAKGVARALAEFPTVRGLGFSFPERPEPALLFVRPWRSFGIDGELGDDGATAVARACPSLRSFWSRNGRIGPEGQRALGGLPLRSLGMHANRGRVAIFPGTLEKLALSECEVDLRSLARSLRALELQDCRVVAGSLEAFRSLERLTLAMCGIADGGVAGLPRAPRLDLQSNDLGPAAVRRLVERKELVELVLSGNPIGDEGARLLAAADLPDLEDLWVSSTGMTEAGLDALARSPLRAKIHVRGEHTLARIR